MERMGRVSRDHQDLTTSQIYDGWGRVIQTINPNNAQVNTAYDSMGRVVSRT